MSRRPAIPPARELRSDAGDGDRSPADVIDEIASELNYLTESRLHPDAFCERRDMLVKRLRRMAKRIGGSDAAPQLTTTFRPIAGATSVKPPAQRARRVEVAFRRS